MLFPLGSFLGIKVADPRDIACMKLSTVASRGTKRDFLDLYVACKLYPLVSLLELFKKKFARVPYNLIHILKSLTYFEEAERDPDPDLLIAISWEEAKGFFIDEVPRLL